MQPSPHQQVFAAHPLAQLAVALALGIVFARFISISFSILLAATAITSVLLLAAMLKQRIPIASVALIFAVFLAGALLTRIERDNIPPNRLRRLLDDGLVPSGSFVELTGVLGQSPELAPESFYLTLRAERIKFRNLERDVSGVISVLVLSQGEKAGDVIRGLQLRYGSRIKVVLALNRADNFRNPGVSSFTEYLDLKGYDAKGLIKRPELIERLDDERVFIPLVWLYEWRQKLEEQIHAHFSVETAGVLDAALLGNRNFLSRATSERFREGGTFHVLVISGLHISFIGGLVVLIARRITKRQSLQFGVSTSVLWGYSFAVGAEASVVRAALMFTLVAFAPLVFRRGASLNSLGASALLLLVWRPSNLFDPSFQLTFGSVVAIIVLAWPLVRRLSEIGSWRPTSETPYPPCCVGWLKSFSESLFWSERHWGLERERLNYSYRLFKAPLALRLERYHMQRPVRYAFGAIVVSVSVQLTLLPLLIVYFHRLPFASFILNIGVSLLMAMLAIVALVALALAQISATLSAPFLGLAHALNWVMVHAVDPFSRIGGASFRLPEYSGRWIVIYVLYYLPLASLAILISRWRSLAHPGTTRSPRHVVSTFEFAVLAQVVVIALVVLHPFSGGRIDGQLRVDFLDVGQGDSALVTMPDGTTLLVDGGGRPDFRRRTGEDDDQEPFARDARSIGEAVVSEYLWWRGLNSVDYILATHADADHIDGLNDVARNFNVRAAFVARVPSKDPEFVKFSETINARQIPLRLIGAGDVLRFGNVRATVLWPVPVSSSEAPSGNNDSIVLRLEFHERRILLTGDIERSTESALLSDGLRADVIKVGHHGSKTSSTQAFVNAVQPEFAIISVGQTSMFGHPNKEVVERWRATGAHVLTTGKSGTITVSTDGRDLALQTFLPR